MSNPNPPHKTNEDLVSDLMNFSRHGALMRVFVLEALGRYAADCAAADPADLNTPYLSGKAWHGCAMEVLQALAQHLGPADAGVQLTIDGASAKPRTSPESAWRVRGFLLGLGELKVVVAAVVQLALRLAARRSEQPDS